MLILTFNYVNFVLKYIASSWNPDGTSASDRKKKRKSRWAQDNDTDKTIIPGMPTVIPNGLSDDQEKQYLCKYQLINDNIHCSSSTRKCVLWFIFHVKKFNSINNYFMLMNLLLGSIDERLGQF